METEKADSSDLEHLIDQLEVVTVESDIWRLEFNSVLGKLYQFNFRYKSFDGSVENNRIPASDAIVKGETFFKNDPGKARFKLKDIEAREIDTPTGPQHQSWAIIEVKLEGSSPTVLKAVSVVVQYEVDGEMKTREIPVPQPG